MFFICHLISIGFAITTGVMWIWGITVKQRFLTVVTFDYINRWRIFYLNAKKPLDDLGKIFNAS